MIARRTVRVMAVGCGLSVANLYYSQPLLERIGAEFGASAARMGIVATATQIGYAAGVLLLAPLGDLLEYRRLIVASLLATAAALAAVAVSPSFGWLAASHLVLGFVTVAPSLIIPFAAAIAEPGERGKVVGTVMSGLLMGILLTRTASGYAGARLGWRAVFWMAAALMLVLAAVMARETPRSRPTLAGSSYGALMRSIVDLLRDVPPLRTTALFGGLGFGSFTVFWTVLAFHLATPPFHYDSDVVGLFGLVGAAGAGVAPWVGAFADRRGTRPAIGLGLATMLAAYLFLAVAGWTVLGLIVGVALLDVGLQGSHIANQTRIYGLLPDARSRMNTVYIVAFFVGGSLGSAASAGVWPWFGWRGACGVGAGFAAAALAVFVASRGERSSFVRETVTTTARPPA